MVERLVTKPEIEAMIELSSLELVNATKFFEATGEFLGKTPDRLIELINRHYALQVSLAAFLAEDELQVSSDDNENPSQDKSGDMD